MLKHQISHPLTNIEFLKVITNSFSAFLESGTSRSTAKLKPLHGAIAKDLKIKLGKEYCVLSQGIGDDREGTVKGRYLDKKVDITIKKGYTPIAALGVKFVMQNYSQNSNNYFENMLGETANIRCNRCPYFQIFIIPDKIPYYNRDYNIKKWETFTDHNAAKYITMSKDNIDVYYHTPNKTLFYIIHIPDNHLLINKKQYIEYYSKLDFQVELSNIDYGKYGEAIIINNYELFIRKIYHTIESL